MLRARIFLVVAIVGMAFIQIEGMPRMPRAIPNWSPSERIELAREAKTSPIGPFVVFDVDKDGKISKQEATAFPDGDKDSTSIETVTRNFKVVDKNGDGFLTANELAGFF